MAIKAIDAQKVELNVGKIIEVVAPTTPSDGFQIDFSAQDERTVFLFHNGGGSAATVKFVKGDGIQGVADTETLSIPQGKIAAFRLDSGAFKYVTGKNKGKAVAIPSSADVKCAVIQLP